MKRLRKLYGETCQRVILGGGRITWAHGVIEEQFGRLKKYVETGDAGQK